MIALCRIPEFPNHAIGRAAPPVFRTHATHILPEPRRRALLPTRSVGTTAGISGPLSKTSLTRASNGVEDTFLLIPQWFCLVLRLEHRDPREPQTSGNLSLLHTLSSQPS